MHPSDDPKGSWACSAPAIVGLPYLFSSSSTPSKHVSIPPPVRYEFTMNRSWHWQMQIHRNYLRLSDTVYSPDRSFQHNTTTMDPTTLVTFLFKAPPEARTVELLGSWDNFTRPYLMEQDRRRGSGFWSGCFKFEHIIFDGDSSGWNKPRSGGLKQGGTYWYYFRLNDEVEAYDDSKEYTTTCPLLPGQPVNVLEVPSEVQDTPIRARSASMDVAVTIGNLPSTHTLDPGDKFNPLNPPPVSRVHGRCVSDYALSGRLESKTQSLRSRDSSRLPPISPVVKADQSISPTWKPTERYYADGDNECSSLSHDRVAEGRTSIQSQRSWNSSASSFAYSSTYEEYESHSNPFDLTPVLELPSSHTGSGSDVSYVEDALAAFGFQDESSSPWIEDVEPWLLQTQPDVPSAAPSSFTAEHATVSRPTTSRGRAQWERLDHLFTDNDNDNNVDYFGDTWDPSGAISPRQSHDRPPRSENDAFDILSPSFSAATISSVGVNTPFRLSLGPSGTTSAHGASHNNDSSIQQVAERLRSLSADDLDRRKNVYESDEPALTTYSLPQPDVASVLSAQSVGKLSSTETTVAYDLSLPPLREQSTAGSLADDIFSELTFL